MVLYHESRTRYPAIFYDGAVKTYRLDAELSSAQVELMEEKNERKK